MKPESTPTQSMRDFFARSDVKALQDIQKRYPTKSLEHKQATSDIKTLAASIGAQSYFE